MELIKMIIIEMPEYYENFRMPEVIDCKDFMEHPKIMAKSYKQLYCIGCSFCITKFQDGGIGTTFTCSKGHPLSFFHIWVATKIGTIKKVNIAFRSEIE